MLPRKFCKHLAGVTGQPFSRSVYISRRFIQIYPVEYNTRCESDRWTKDWFAEKREEGETGLTVEKRGGVHYLKWATTRWDPETKKRRKISEYRDVLNQDGTVTDPRPRHSRIDAVRIVDSGNARLLARATESLLEPLKFAFPNDYPEMIELAFARCLSRGELNKAGRCWKRLEDVFGLCPNTLPRACPRPWNT